MANEEFFCEENAIGDSKGIIFKTIKNARVQAFNGAVVHYKGGLILSDTPDDKRLRHNRNQKPVDSFNENFDPKSFIGGNYIYAGPISNHFGHFMSEHVHRILPARLRFGKLPILFVTSKGDKNYADLKKLPDFVIMALHLLNVEQSDIHIINEDTTVENLHISEQASCLGVGPMPNYLTMLRDQVHNILEEDKLRCDVYEKVYVSRSSIKTGATFLGESYIEKILEDHGFFIFKPENYSLIQQMKIYKSAKKIIFTEGSACHGTELLGAHGLSEVFLIRKHRNNMFSNVLKPRSSKFGFLPDFSSVGTFIINKNTNMPHSNSSAYLFDLKNFENSLQQTSLALDVMFDKDKYFLQCEHDIIQRLMLHINEKRNIGPSELIAKVFGNLAAAKVA